MSVARDADPIFMGSANDVAVRDENYDDGYTNKCLDISEFSVAATNRELVNLENAAVNIDNSSDVIIGPVTQFNVNGNVTIYQNKDGLPIGIEQNDDDIIPNCNGNVKGINAFKEYITRYQLNYNKTICFLVLIAFAIMIAVKLTLRSLSQEVPEEVSNDEKMCYCHVNTFYKADWGGKVPTKNIVTLNSQVPYVIIKHTGGEFCQTTEKCKDLTKHLQQSHLSLNYSDIAYNFLIGGDGNIYVGRGFQFSNQFGGNTYDIAIHGNFLYDQFYDYMENATKIIIDYGVSMGYIIKNYSVLCDNQTEKVDSPGRNVYNKVKKWDHFVNYTFYQ